MSATSTSNPQALEQLLQRLLEQLVRPMGFEELQGLVGLSGAQLVGAMRQLERDGKVRFTRGLYERTQSVVAMVDQPAMAAPAPILPAPSPVTEKPQPPRAAIAPARPAVPIAAPPDTSEETTMAKTKTCLSGAECVEGPDPKPVMAFYRPGDARCKKCVLKRQRDAKLAKKSGKPAPAVKADKASPPPRRAPGAAPRSPPTAVQTSAPALLLPAQPRFAAAIESTNGCTRIQLANDEERVVELTPAQMDQLCDWWRGQSRAQLHS